MKPYTLEEKCVAFCQGRLWYYDEENQMWEKPSMETTPLKTHWDAPSKEIKFHIGDEAPKKVARWVWYFTTGMGSMRTAGALTEAEFKKALPRARDAVKIPATEQHFLE